MRFLCSALAQASQLLPVHRSLSAQSLRDRGALLSATSTPATKPVVQLRTITIWAASDCSARDNNISDVLFDFSYFSVGEEIIFN